MKKKTLLWVCSAICFVLFASSPGAQKPARTITLLYSNNINAEIDPCPT